MEILFGLFSFSIRMFVFGIEQTNKFLRQIINKNRNIYMRKFDVR